MLEVNGLTIRYGPVRAVSDLSLVIKGGESVALIGANGAGKSSVLRGILGLAQAGGSIVLDGCKLDGLPAHRRVLSGVALSPEGRHIFAGMTVAENLAVGAVNVTDDEQRRLADEMYGLFPRLFERREQEAGSLSGGEQQMLAIARALMSKPKLLMLDEPTLGLAPIIVAQIVVLIENLTKRGLAVLLAEQNAEVALSASDRAYVLETGYLKRGGASRDLAEDPAIQADYLGF